MEKQPFEKYESLSSVIEWYANNVPVPGSKWNLLLHTINNTLLELENKNAILLEASTVAHDRLRNLINEDKWAASGFGSVWKEYRQLEEAIKAVKS